MHLNNLKEEIISVLMREDSKGNKIIIMMVDILEDKASELADKSQ